MLIIVIHVSDKILGIFENWAPLINFCIGYGPTLWAECSTTDCLIAERKPTSRSVVHSDTSTGGRCMNCGQLLRVTNQWHMVCVDQIDTVGQFQKGSEEMLGITHCSGELKSKLWNLVFDDENSCWWIDW